MRLIFPKKFPLQAILYCFNNTRAAARAFMGCYVTASPSESRQREYSKPCVLEWGTCPAPVQGRAQQAVSQYPPCATKP